MSKKVSELQAYDTQTTPSFIIIRFVSANDKEKISKAEKKKDMGTLGA